MDSQPLTIEEIRAQMRIIRRDLRENVQEIVVGASQIFDWKNYVRSFPWTFVAAAALVGYLIVPRRKGPPAGLMETKQSIEQLAEEIKAATPPKPPPETLASTLWPLFRGVALRVGTVYLTRLGTSWLEQWLNQPPPGQHRPTRPSPPHVPSRQPR